MNLANSKNFDRVVKAVFMKLCHSFPLPVQLDAQDLGLSHEPSGERVNGHWVESGSITEHRFFFHTVSWLVSNGYVQTASSSEGYVFENAVFTEKSLQATKLLPTSLKY